MTYITLSLVFALLALAGVFLFLFRYALAAHRGPLGVGWLREEPSQGLSGMVLSPPAPRPLTFAETCHPMEKADRLPILLITLIYALTAFFQLGDTSAPTVFYNFGQGESVTIQISGDPVQVAGFRYYTGLGTGARVSGEDGRAYNVEISTDGEHWSTLWHHRDDDGDITSYYFADATGYAPSYALFQKYNQLFKWLDVTVETPLPVRYLRITGNCSANGAGQKVLQLGRLCLLDSQGRPISFDWTMADGSAASEELQQLFLVDHLVPDKSTWHNSTYFDEIYHARTAKEHIDGVYPYEVTHPPLGKLILGIGIRLFGMTPFGWRFSGTLFGVLMLPILYVFLKNLFGKTVVAACGTTLFAADFMHLTQTRIATIDTYGVFFILCMYFFMYRYLTLPAGTPFRKGALPLFLSGLTWGLGAASKWTVFYAGIGLAVVYFIGFYQKLRDWPQDRALRARRSLWVGQTLLFSVLCFVVIPFAIYCASYYPYILAREVPLLAGTPDPSLPFSGFFARVFLSFRDAFVPLFQNVRDALTGAAQAEGYRAAEIPREDLLGVVAHNQWYMFHYHQGVSDPHPYSSRWYHWILNARPILYYMDNTVRGYTTRFAAFSNPAVCWAGLGAILICAGQSFRRWWAKAACLLGIGAFAVTMVIRTDGILDPALAQVPFTFYLGDRAIVVTTLQRNICLLAVGVLLYLLLAFLAFWASPGHSGKAAFILVGYLAQLLPWMLIGRTTFEYHYFPSILFLVLALSYLFNGFLERDLDWKTPVYSFTGLSVGLYALFYPVLIGLSIPLWYEPLVKWLESWPF